jgi:hypothetical protein
VAAAFSACGLKGVTRLIPQPAKTLQGEEIGDSYSSHYQSHQRFQHGNRCMGKCRTFARSKARVSFQTEIRSLAFSPFSPRPRDGLKSGNSCLPCSNWRWAVTAPNPNVENTLPEFLAENSYPFSTVHAVEPSYLSNRTHRDELAKSYPSEPISCRFGTLGSGAPEPRLSAPPLMPSAYSGLA